MSIRKKLLILLLVVALAPLILTSLLYRYWTHSLGNHLAAGARKTLTQSARLQLQQLVAHFVPANQSKVYRSTCFSMPSGAGW